MRREIEKGRKKRKDEVRKEEEGEGRRGTKERCEERGRE